MPEVAPTGSGTSRPCRPVCQTRKCRHHWKEQHSRSQLGTLLSTNGCGRLVPDFADTLPQSDQQPLKAQVDFALLLCHRVKGLSVVVEPRCEKEVFGDAFAEVSAQAYRSELQKQFSFIVWSKLLPSSWGHFVRWRGSLWCNTKPGFQLGKIFDAVFVESTATTASITNVTTPARSAINTNAKSSTENSIAHL